MRIGLGIGIPQFQGNGPSGIASSINFAQLVTGDVPSGWTFTRSTSGTYFDASGVLQLASTNVLRISRDPVSGELGYLAEPGRTNLVTYSEQFDNASWTKSGATVTADQTTAPSGIAVGDLVTSTVTGSNAQVLQNFASTAAAYTASVYVKQGTAAVCDFALIDQGTVANRIRLTFATGQISTVSGSATSTVTAEAGGWYRLSITYTFPAIGAADTVAINAGPSGGSVTGETVYVYGAQVEAGSYPTSYIPTTTVAVSRGADLLTTTLSAAHAAALSVAGAMVARFTSFNDDSTSLYVAASVYASTGAEHAIYRYKSWHGSRTLNSGTQFDQQLTASSGVPHKFAHAWEVDNCRGASDGTLTTADVAPSTMPAVTTVGIGARSGGTNQPIGLIHSFALYTSRLTDAQLQALTA